MEATCKTCPSFHVDRDCAEDVPGFECRVGPVAVGVDPDHWCSEHPLRQRDRLAAMAMQGILGHPDVDFRKTAPGACARIAYAFADAMLAALSPQDDQGGGR